MFLFLWLDLFAHFDRCHNCYCTTAQCELAIYYPEESRSVFCTLINVFMAFLNMSDNRILNSLSPETIKLSRLFTLSFFWRKKRPFRQNIKRTKAKLPWNWIHSCCSGSKQTNKKRNHRGTCVRACVQPLSISLQFSYVP